jgi:hypothetical protein
MKGDLREILGRQAAWQRARSARSWAEKLRTAVIMRQALLAIRKPLADSPKTAPTPHG